MLLLWVGGWIVEGTELLWLGETANSPCSWAVGGELFDTAQEQEEFCIPHRLLGGCPCLCPLCTPLHIVTHLAAGTWAGRTFLARLSKGSRLGALAFPTDTVASATAHLTVIRNATVSLC
uniref:Secreted protein n=1 Tax=Gopherus agassizii TaxID=38772 RepID=A0A452ILN8_9SAUR